MGKNEEGIEVINFDKLKGKSLGSPSNILFWNDQQKLVSRRIEKLEHTLLMGDYGTGDFLDGRSTSRGYSVFPLQLFSCELLSP